MKDFGKVECAVCGHKAHFPESHLGKDHEMTVEAYTDLHPDARVLSEVAEEKLAEVERRIGRPHESAEVKKLFGIDMKIPPVKRFKSPHPTTPAIDSDYSFRKNHLLTVLYVVANTIERQMALFTGPTGSGKTSIIEQVAARLNWAYYRIAFDGDVTRSDFIGQWTLKNGNTVWQEGILPKAMREGAILCLDEWDTASPSVGLLLQPVLEGRPLAILETGEILHPHDDFRVFATANTIGQGDTTGLYSGTQVQSFATLDRFNLVDVVDYPNKSEEERILRKKVGCDRDASDRFLEVARLMRESFLKGQAVATMSTRTVVNIAKKVADFGDVHDAYRLAYLNKLNPEDKALAFEFVQRVWGTFSAPYYKVSD